MKSLYNVVAVAPAPMVGSDRKPNRISDNEVHIGLYESTTILDVGVREFLFGQIPIGKAHMNNSVIVPNIDGSMFLECDMIELPIAAAVWQEEVKYWTYINFILKITCIPLLVNVQDATAYVNGMPFTPVK